MPTWCQLLTHRLRLHLRMEAWRNRMSFTDPGASRPLEQLEQRLLMSGDPLQFRDYALFAGDDLTLGNDARVERGLTGSAEDVVAGRNARLAGAYGGDDLRLGHDARVTGGAGFDDDASLGRNARVEGGLTLGGTLTLDRDARVSGGLVERFPDAWADLPAPTPIPADAAPAGTADVRVRQDDRNATLVPGAYGHLRLDRDARLTLRPGEYSFASIDLGDP